MGAAHAHAIPHATMGGTRSSRERNPRNKKSRPRSRSINGFINILDVSLLPAMRVMRIDSDPAGGRRFEKKERSPNP